MGLPLGSSMMENLHAPTVPSGPTTAYHSTNSDSTQGLTLPELQTKKDNLEAELRALGGVLESHGVDMNTRLLTPDGFPRADLDIAQIRTTRARIIHLRNDYKTLMSVIEKHIHAHFASLSSADTSSPSPSTLTSNGTSNGTWHSAHALQTPLSPPFAKVNSVAAGSPASDAGLKAGDEIRNFGYVNAGNHEGLKRVAECVKGNEGRAVVVKVSRSTDGGERQELTLRLTPRNGWGGRGMLGCHVLPL